MILHFGNELVADCLILAWQTIPTGKKSEGIICHLFFVAMSTTEWNVIIIFFDYQKVATRLHSWDRDHGATSLRRRASQVKRSGYPVQKVIKL